MNINYKRLPIEFGPEIGFEAIPVAPFRVALESTFERLKHQLLNARLQDLADPAYNSQLRRASNEAEALAWLTPYPLLVFPALFDERAEAVGACASWQAEDGALNRTLVPV